jgi:hypothetical protein
MEKASSVPRAARLLFRNWLPRKAVGRHGTRKRAGKRVPEDGIFRGTSGSDQPHGQRRKQAFAESLPKGPGSGVWEHLPKNCNTLAGQTATEFRRRISRLALVSQRLLRNVGRRNAEPGRLERGKTGAKE